jgi:hypothetical protein
MDIISITTNASITQSKLARTKSVVDVVGGEMKLVDFSVTSGAAMSALMFCPEGQDFALFVCAGRKGPWMKPVAEAFANEFEVEVAKSSIEQVVAKRMDSYCEDFPASMAMAKGFNLYSTPANLMEFRRTTGDRIDLLSCEAWGGDVPSKCDTISAQKWGCGHIVVDQVTGKDLSSVTFGNAMSIKTAMIATEVAAQMKITGDNYFADLMDLSMTGGLEAAALVAATKDRNVSILAGQAPATSGAVDEDDLMNARDIDGEGPEDNGYKTEEPEPVYNSFTM